MYVCIYCYSELCYNDRWYIAATYRFALQDIVTAISRLNDITVIYREDRDGLSLIYCFDAHRFERYLADLSAINHRNKARYSAIIACFTVAQYCIVILCFQLSLPKKHTQAPNKKRKTDDTQVHVHSFYLF